MFSLGTDYKWSYIFDIMETNKGSLKLKDYSVTQTTLEQVKFSFKKGWNLIRIYNIYQDFCCAGVRKW